MDRGSEFVISDLENSRVPNFTQIKLLFVFGPSYSVWRSVLSHGPFLLHLSLLYTKMLELIKFINKQNLDTLIYLVIDGLVGSVVACS